MNKTYGKDIWRSVRKGWKRFLSIVIITALGVAMLTGLYASCKDMYYSADQFYDQQNLFDIRILSTLGLDQQDVDVLSNLDGVDLVEGAYRETVHTQVEGARKSVELSVLSQSGLNSPYVLEGSLPSNEKEIAVTEKYLIDSGKSIGDTVIIEEDMDDDISSEEDNHKDDTADDRQAEEEKAANYANTTYLITGKVLDPMDIQSDGMTSVIRSSEHSDYTFFVKDNAASYDIYTAVYLTLANTKERNSYSKEYEKAVQAVIDDIEMHWKKEREQARYALVLSEALAKLNDAKKEMDEEFRKADQKFADAWEELVDGKQKLLEGESTLNQEEMDAADQFADARSELAKVKQKLHASEKQLMEGKAKLNEGEAELQARAKELEAGKQQFETEKKQAMEQLNRAQKQLEEAQSQLDTEAAELEDGKAQLQLMLADAWPEKEWDALVKASTALAATGADDKAIAEGTSQEAGALTLAILQSDIPSPQIETLAEISIATAIGLGQVKGGQQALTAQKSAFEEYKRASMQKLTDAELKLRAGEEQLEAARQEISSKKAELATGYEKLADGKTELADGEARLKEEEENAKQKLADARKEIEDKKKELADGEAEYIEKKQEYEKKKQEARKELADGYAKLEEIEEASWYVQDRSSLDSYASLTSDLSSIEAVGKVFPVIFLLVAVLMSLTTMTRMVEEERGLIGTYKGLGFGNASVYRKYVLFALLACILGGILGDIIGFIFMPKFITFVLRVLYTLPQYYLRFDIPYGVGGVLLFTIAIVGATALACRSELAHMPANLMRPKTPRAGSRVLLERIPLIWQHLKFLNKVTARNIFRYKKRMFMTIGGIAGCTALILCGFAIKDSITDLEPKQYDGIYHYDLMTVFQEKDRDDFLQKLSEDSNIQDYLALRIESVKLINAEGKAEQVQFMVIPDGATLEDYISIRSKDGAMLPISDSGIFVTRNAAQLLGLKTGDRVCLQDKELIQGEAVIASIVQNYLGNHVYMAESLYEKTFGAYETNGILAHLSDRSQDHAAYAKSLLEDDSVLSSVSTAVLRANYGFDLINAVILLMIVMAGGLAFVVLFTLSNTNISERARELATIKVLGFFDHEVHQYVNKETLLLTIAGIFLGLPLGHYLSGLLTLALKMPSIYFAVQIEPVSYVISALITFCFALLVNLMTNRMLDRIDMVEALKSVE